MDSMGCSSPSTEGTELNGSLLNSSGDVTSTRLTQSSKIYTHTVSNLPKLQENLKMHHNGGQFKAYQTLCLRKLGKEST